MMRWNARPISWGSAMASSWSGRSGRAGQHRDRRDLDQGALAQEPGHDHAGGGRETLPEELPADAGGAGVVLGGRDVVGGLHDVLEAAARGPEQPAELLEDVAGLGHDVARPDDLPVLVSPGRARDEEEIARAHRRRERVAGRPGGPAGDHLVRGHRLLLEPRRETTDPPA